DGRHPMTDTMGRVMETIRIVNFIDEQRAKAAEISPANVRSTEIEALVDPAATMLMLPADVIARLGLPVMGHRNVRYADGRVAEVPWVGGAKIVILGREAICNALVEAAGTTPLIGQIPLEELDLLVDPKSRRLQVNPASPEAPLLDLLGAA